MNILDLFIFLAITWQGVWGYFRGVKTTLITLLGIFLSLVVTAAFHASLARSVAPVFIDAISPHVQERFNLEVNPVILNELGLSREVINYWYHEIGHEKVIGIEVTKSFTGGELNQVEPILFLAVNILTFLVFFWTLKYFSSTLADMIIKREKRVNELKNSWCGLVLGILQGFLISMLYLFIFILITPVDFFQVVTKEIYNSQLAGIMLGMITHFWELIVL